MVYSNLPVSVEATDLLPDSVSVSYSTNSSVRRKLGGGVDGFGFNAGLGVDISINFLLGQNGADFLLDTNNLTGALAYNVSVGNNTFSDCYLNSYDITVVPFQPVVVKADFTSYDPVELVPIAPTPNPLDNNDSFVYSHTGVLVGDIPSLLTNATYNKRYSRTPVYTLGSIQPVRQLIDEVEAELTVESTGIDSLINYSGKKITADFGVTLSADHDIIVASGSRILDQSYDMQGGGALSTTMRIREIIL